MKKIFTLATVIIFSLPAFSQTPAWLWAYGLCPGYGTDIATDANDNIYITGIFSGAPFIFGGDTLMYVNQDVFIAKYDAAGNEIWARSVQGAGNESVKSVCTDVNSNAYIFGAFFAPNPIILGNDTLTSAGATDVFIAKYDSAGNEIWARRAGGSNFEYADAAAADNSGNIYVAGRFSSTSVTFGSITLVNTGSGGQDVFLVKYDSSGNVLWARSDAGDGFRGIAFDAADNVFLSGVYSDASITYGSTVLYNADATGSTVDLFVAKHDSAGNIIRAWDGGGTDNDGTAGISVTSDGHVYIAGGFTSNTITFGSTTLVNSASYDDIFIAKYDSVGNALWARKAGGSYNQWPRDIGIDASGNAYVIGYFQSATCTFGSIVLTNAGSFNEDIFVAKYDAAGNLMWAIGAGGTGADNANAAVVNAAGNVCITGSFGSPSLSFGSMTLTNSGGAHIFTAKLDYATGITGLSDNLGVKIFPNPVANQFTIYNVRCTISTVEIYNVLGEKIFSQQLKADSQGLMVDVPGFSPGIYFVKVKGEKEEYVSKFIKQ